MKSPPRRARKKPTFSDYFTNFARGASNAMGSHWASLTAVLVIVVWATTGPIFGYSDTWQLVINTGTTIVTFIMVFLIQNTQNRDSKVLQLKLDEVIRAVRGARNSLVDLEDMPDDELERLAAEFAEMHEREREVFKEQGHDLGPDCDDEEEETGKARRPKRAKK
jgi:low affinity Fe/Cu permease